MKLLIVEQIRGMVLVNFMFEFYGSLYYKPRKRKNSMNDFILGVKVRPRKKKEKESAC